MEASSSNSSDQKRGWMYDVFLSFRGEDTRNGFADHLYVALKENGILTFRDDQELERGEIISEQLPKAIQESLFAIVILSPNYPSSSWCLDELQGILESKRVSGQQVFPVFYGVDPSLVRHQKESFAKFFRKHEERFGEESIKIQTWRKALKEVANLSGWDAKNRRETELIEEIVQEIYAKLQPFFPSHYDELVGIDSKMKEIYSLLRLNEVNDVHFIGIWGMSGVGKTTLARVVYERIKKQFNGSCFLQDIGEFSKKQGLVELQRKLLSDLKVKCMEIKDLYDGMTSIRNILCNKRILVILDDVNAIEQLENLVGDKKWFGKGSRVIITTRNRHLMETNGNASFENYVVGLLNSDESLQLFCQKAFKRDQPKEEYLQLSKNVVQYAGGLPLALKVLGSFLCGRNMQEWRDALVMLKQDPHDDILKTLRVSYDGLQYTYKAIFLDIACFFKGWHWNHVTHILQICGYNPTIGIEVLIEKSLITFDGQSLGMHDLLQDMGKHIVFHESPSDASGRSRLWSIEDIDHVLAKNKENEVIQGIVLNLHKPYQGHWNLEAFSKICNLKLLILRTNLHHFNGLNCLSRALRFLQWEGYPLESLPPSIQLNNLVDLKLRHSQIKQLWSGIKAFEKLKLIDLSHSEYLIQTPNVSGVPYLQTMIFEGCINLVEVHLSIQQHKKIAILNLKDCLNLKILPNKLEMNSLEHLTLSGCSKVKKLPEFGDNMECLSILDLKDCKNLHCLPNTICNLKSLKILNIYGCSKISRMPNNLNKNEALEELDASGTAIRDVPCSIFQLKNLKKLSFAGCKASPSNSWDLSLPIRWFWKFWSPVSLISLMLPSISHMPLLRELDLRHCNLNDGSIPNDLGSLSSLLDLNLSGNNFVNIPTHCISSLSKLYELDLSACAKLQLLPALPPSLVYLHPWECASMNFVSYSQRLHDLFASDDHQKEEWSRYGFLIFPGSEIPMWFHNQNYHSMDFVMSTFLNEHGFDSIVSIVVDIPDHCRFIKSWGIAVCLVSEFTPSSSEGCGVIRWTCKAPEDDYASITYPSGGYLVKKFNYSHMYIEYLSNKEEEIQENLRADTNQLELIFCSRYFEHTDCEEGKEKTKFKIRKCGWRLLWKDNMEMWTNASTEIKSVISNGEGCSNLNKSTRLAEIAFEKSCQEDGLEEDGVTLSNPRPSKRGKLQ